MLKVTDFAERALPGLTERLREKGFVVETDVNKLNDDTLIILTPGQLNIYRRFQRLLVLCSSETDLEKMELKSLPSFRYEWELVRYLEAPVSQFEGKYLLTGFSACRVGLHAQMKGWKLLTTPGEEITYIHQDPTGATRERAYYATPCLVKNSLLNTTLDLVCDKSILYTKMQRYIPETEPLSSFQFKSGVFIAKPAGVGAYKGEGITIVRSVADLSRARREIAKNKNWTGIISRYINNPLLFQGRKFHVRVYMIVTSARTYSVFSRSHIFTAKLKYVPGKYEKSYSDSHGTTTEEDWEFEKDFPDSSPLRVKIEEVCAEIWNVIGDQLECYTPSKYGYEVIAPDIMFDENLNPWLLEVNRKVGLAPHGNPESYAGFMFDFYSWVFRHGVEPFLTLQ